MPSPVDQSRYQVRFEQGLAGLRRLAPADVVVLVDVLETSARAIDSAAADGLLALDALPSDVQAIATEGAASLVFAGGLRNASAVAEAILAEQSRRGERTSVALIAAAPDGRPAVENQLAAGAIADALAARGIDHSSPEAAVACESFRALRGAVRHMLTAGGTGQAFVDDGRREHVLAQARIDDTGVVPVLRVGVFTRL